MRSPLTPKIPHDRILVIGSTPDASALGAACAVAVQLQRELYRVDPAAIMGKTVGETGKNLAELIGRAEEQSWILFFDEADALFGKRTTVRDSHDRHANVDASYLLERLARFRGVVVFAVHSQEPIDETLLRRFQRVIRPALKPARRRPAG
jgi:SpoVK/Ycf46/Vps4 family AAA+-type ATPase